MLAWTVSTVNASGLCVFCWWLMFLWPAVSACIMAAVHAHGVTYSGWDCSVLEHWQSPATRHRDMCSLAFQWAIHNSVPKAFWNASHKGACSAGHRPATTSVSYYVLFAQQLWQVLNLQAAVLVGSPCLVFACAESNTQHAQMRHL